MCRQHAKLIDADDTNYSETTLRQWKVLAERRAYEALEQGPIPGSLAEPDTLIAIGLNVVVKGVWLAGGQNEWRFGVTSFYRGNQTLLRDEIENNQIEFVVIESQGDGRLLAGAPKWDNTNGSLELTVPVKPRVARMDPDSLGTDLALDKTGDLFVKNGSLARVKGVESAIQRISTTMGMMLGEWFADRDAGALTALYYHKFNDKPETLARLLKLELARLATIPRAKSPPPLNSIWRVNSVNVPDISLSERRLSVDIELEWCNAVHWSGNVKVFIHENLDKLSPKIKR
jgi:hypothetical protein